MTGPDRTGQDRVSLFSAEALGFSFAAAGLLLWPLLTTGGHAFLFVDSAVYADQGDRIWAFARDLFAAAPPPVEGAGAADGPRGDVLSAMRAQTDGADTVRSVPYAAFLGAFLPFGAAVFLYVQALMVTATLYVVLALIVPDRRWLILGPALAVALAASPAATMASFLMPDIFGAVVVLFAIVLALGLERIGPASRVVLFAIAILAVTFHYGNIPLALGLFAVAALLRTNLRQALRVLFGVAGGTVLIAVGLNVAIGVMGFDTTSVAPGRAPIVLARSIEDGPARWVLQEDCASPAPRYALCDYWGTGIPDNVGDALWDEGGMNHAPPALYARIRAEEVDLLLEAVRTYPLQQVAALVGNARDQALVVWPRYANAAEFVLRPNGRRTDRPVEDAAFETLRPVLNGLHEIGYAAGVAGLLAFLVLSRDALVRKVAVVVLAGLALNALIFGGLSAPVPRYQARVSWLALVVVVLLLARLHAQGTARAADAGGAAARPRDG